jgi:hypothetical protein
VLISLKINGTQKIYFGRSRGKTKEEFEILNNNQKLAVYLIVQLFVEYPDFRTKNWKPLYEETGGEYSSVRTN